jgi:cytidylate kinase
MYRALTWLVLQRGFDPNDEEAASRLAHEVRMEVGPPPADGSEFCSVRVDDRDATPFLRTPEVENAVSLVSRVPGVRKVLVRLQRRAARDAPIVMAGRDIGTTVLPDAELKVYLDASREERARRRQRQAALKGGSPSLEQVLADLDRRDAIDSEREMSPLRPAEDADLINTDGLSMEEVVEKVLSLVEGS